MRLRRCYTTSNVVMQQNRDSNKRTQLPKPSFTSVLGADAPRDACRNPAPVAVRLLSLLDF